MSDASDPVYVDPYEEGYHFAKNGQVNAYVIAQPSEWMAEQIAYSAYDWRRFRMGALKALMEMAS